MFLIREVSGKDLTPFLLKRVNEITQGGSLKSSTNTNRRDLLIRIIY